MRGMVVGEGGRSLGVLLYWHKGGVVIIENVAKKVRNWVLYFKAQYFVLSQKQISINILNILLMMFIPDTSHRCPTPIVVTFSRPQHALGTSTYHSFAARSFPSQRQIDVLSVSVRRATSAWRCQSHLLVVLADVECERSR